MTPLEKILAMPNEAHSEFLNGASDTELNTLTQACSDVTNDPDADHFRASEVLHLCLAEKSSRLLALEDQLQRP